MSLLLLYGNKEVTPSAVLEFDSSLPAGFTQTRNDTVSAYRDSSGNKQLATANQPLFDHDIDGNPIGLQSFGAMQNKCTNTNVSPTVTTNATKSGDAAGVFAADIDDTAALTTAKLHTLGTKVFELDNSGGSTTATVTFGGTVGNTNPHSFQIYARMVSGTFGTIQLTGGAPGTVSFNSTSYTLVKSENVTPSGTTVQMKINAVAGAKIRFTLNQLEEYPVCTPLIKIAGAAATRAAQVAKYDDFYTQPWWNQSQGTIIAEVRPVAATGNSTFRTIFVAGSDEDGFPNDAFYAQSNQTSNTPNFYGKQNDTAGTPVAALSTPLTGRKNSIAAVYRNGIDLRLYAGPAVHTNAAVAMGGFLGAVIKDLHIGCSATGGQNFNGWISKVLFFKEALTPSQAAPFMLGTYTGHTERGIICAGQSNMEGYFAAASVLTNGGERVGVALLDTVWGTSTRNWLINGSTAGTNIAAWTGSGAAITKWKSIARAFAAAGGTIDGILWDQGESNLGNSVATLKSSYLAIFNDMRTHLSSLGQGDVNICMVPLGRLTDDDTDTRNTNCSYLRQAQQELAAENAFICIAPEKSLHPLVDTTHLTDAGYQLSANLTLRKLLDFNGESISGGVDGGMITEASFAATTVTAILTHDTGGTDFTPTSAIGGFQFYDDGVLIPWAVAPARTNATTITGTLDSEPSGAIQELWYAWGSIYDDAGSTLVRDNNALPLRSGKFILPYTG